MQFCCTQEHLHMPQNKNAHLRYRIIDQCLQQRNRSWSKVDLINAIDEALTEIDPNHDGVAERTLQEDLRFMRSIDGFNAPISHITRNRRRFYRYEDPSFRIHRSPVNRLEREAIAEVISIMDRFDGAPQFEWMQNTINLLEENLKLNRKTTRKLLIFDDNIDYIGWQHIRNLTKLIEGRRLLKIKYQPFAEEELELLFHPQLLREYNNRWFLMGWQDDKLNSQIEKPWNLALDRILKIEEIGPSSCNKEFDWDDYFSDIIGVSRREGEPQEVAVLVNETLLPYLETKPLHGSQKPAQKHNDGRYLIRYQLIPNYELEYQLLAFGEDLEVIKPKSLRRKMQSRIAATLKNYS